MSKNLHLDQLASLLEQTGDYRVLRRLTPRATYDQTADAAVARGVFLDLETTGLDPAMHEVIEIALVPFTYSADGQILNVEEPYCSFQDPFMPISPEITKLTGITPEMVQGSMIDVAEVERIIADASWICAHNSRFDRPFAEQITPAFARKRWACSLTQVPWKEEGFGGAKLGYLLADLGFFASFHRAHEDCLAAIEILSRRLPKSETTAFAKLIEAAEAPVYRVWASLAPFERKDALKARGYRWNGTPNPGRPKAWYRDLPEDLVGLEFEYLRREIYGYDADILITEVTPYDRFSNRI
ncbi:3'-5' exonuclease [Methylobacterium brachiatum]|uniref:3'-5' exonuclease n=1 Tax=Methylobacterium brachiatum TaxID=269660 RepID=UPI000EFC5E09|nr:3'-5' exonuclease [Methylobacterium brachiatum]AYO81041.1 3'-5' exonuclease [Methylobacterium brachiatum]